MMHMRTHLSRESFFHFETHNMIATRPSVMTRHINASKNDIQKKICAMAGRGSCGR